LYRRQQQAGFTPRTQHPVKKYLTVQDGRPQILSLFFTFFLIEYGVVLISLVLRVAA
jgi:hypothetical protein